MSVGCHRILTINQIPTYNLASITLSIGIVIGITFKGYCLMTELLINQVEVIAGFAHVWGFLIVLVLMTVESSFIPFPSEVVLIPAGIMAFRGELFFTAPMTDFFIIVFCGVLGSILGACINYYLAMKLGRPSLYKYGKYFFLKVAHIERAEEIFQRHGKVATLVCRLLPAIRQLISIPAGLSKMPINSFILYTALGAGVWSFLLTATGYYMATEFGSMTYRELVHRGISQIHSNLPWLLAGLFVFMIIYYFVHRLVLQAPSIEREG